VCQSEALASYIYKTGTCERVLLAGPTSHSGWVNPPLINSRSSIITARDDFLFCLLQLSDDQSAKGDLVLIQLPT
jgi:hypothetical protein